MNNKNLPWIITAVAVVALGGVLVAQKMGTASQRHPDPRPDVNGATVIPASNWNFEPIVRAYTAAAQNAQVIDGLYCHCGCKESINHRSLLTCFETDHGSACDICMEEVELAARMHGQGATLDQIRQEIDKQYGS
ncbi:MAG: CYCXC family (seleno)protein [Gemmatimonadales bacterium]|nr:CYCXC family (seleno)protein [Gemmatimonadales bacterium]